MQGPGPSSPQPRWAPATRSEIVYGVLATEHYLVLVPRQRAEELASIHAAVQESQSWDEFRSRIPQHDWRELVRVFEENEEEPSEPFEPDAVPGYADGDWPDWPAQRMLDWVPKPIQERFGRMRDSVFSGPFLELDPTCSDEIAEALERHGFQVSEDADLVARASGY